MKITHLGYEIECKAHESWDGKVKSNYLSVRKLGEHVEKDILNMWWDQKEKDGIKYAVKLVDKHIKAMTITPGKG